MNNGYNFRTTEYERDMNTQNNKVMVSMKTLGYASTSDARPIMGNDIYYG